MNRTRCAFVVSLLTLSATSATVAFGQACPCAPATPPPPPPPPRVTVSGDVGYVNTTGNTNVSTLNATDQFTLRTAADNQILQTFGLVYGTQANRVQTSIWNASLKDEYTFTPHIGLYALGAFDRNTFAGIDRRFEEGAGIAFIPLDSVPNNLEIDAGMSFIEQTATIDSTDNHAAARAAITYRHTFVATTYVQEFVEGIEDLKTTEDYRINSQTDVVAPLSKHLAIKVGYAIHYSNLPPVGFKTTDRLLTTDIQVTY
jgi:putative salt-induced outer membrane protein YdiY